MMVKKAKGKKHPVRELAGYLEAIAHVATSYSIQLDRILGHVFNRESQVCGEDEDIKIPAADLAEEIKRLYGEQLQLCCEAVSHGVEEALPVVEGIHQNIAPATKNPLVWETNLAKTLRQLKNIIEVDSLCLLESGCGVPKIDGAIAFNQSVSIFSDKTLATRKKIDEKVRVLLKKVEDLRCVAIPGESGTPAINALDAIRKRGKKAMTPERREECQKHYLEWVAFYQKWKNDGKKGKARLAFSKVKKMEQNESDAMIRSGILPKKAKSSRAKSHG